MLMMPAAAAADDAAGDAGDAADDAAAALVGNAARGESCLVTLAVEGYRMVACDNRHPLETSPLCMLDI